MRRHLVALLPALAKIPLPTLYLAEEPDRWPRRFAADGETLFYVTEDATTKRSNQLWRRRPDGKPELLFEEKLVLGAIHDLVLGIASPQARRAGDADAAAEPEARSRQVAEEAAYVWSFCWGGLAGPEAR